MFEGNSHYFQDFHPYGFQTLIHLVDRTCGTGLPPHVRESESVAIFKTKLKTQLFGDAY